MIRRLLATLVGVLAAMIAVAVPASAHTTLESSSPVDDAKVNGVPPSIVLKFGEPLQGTTANVGILVGNNDPVRIEAAVDGPTVTVDTSIPAIAELTAKGADGKWAIGYQVVSADGHPIDGTMSFTVTGTGKPAGETSSATSADSPDEPQQVAPWLWGLILLASAAAVFAVVKIDRARRKKRTSTADSGAADSAAADSAAADPGAADPSAADPGAGASGVDAK